MSCEYYENLKKIYELTNGPGKIGRTNLMKHYSKMKKYLQEQTVTEESNNGVAREQIQCDNIDTMNVNIDVSVITQDE